MPQDHWNFPFRAKGARQAIIRNSATVAGRMKTGSGSEKSEGNTSQHLLPELKLLVQLEPWHKNLSSLLKTRAQEPLHLSSSPAAFWSDVFVDQRLPWRRFGESVFFHLLVIAGLWGTWQLVGNRPRFAPASSFNRADVIYYPDSEYLPPLNSRPRISYHAQKGQPAYAKQDIISVPSDPDNDHQTIVTPPKVKLTHDVPMPNIVAWSPSTVAVPTPAAAQRSAADMRIPELPTNVVAPPPELRADSRMRNLDAPQTSVVAPPPAVQMAGIRQSEIDIGHAEIIAPAPKLPMAEQHRAGGFANTATGGSPWVVPPPPTMGTSSGARGGGQLIALSVRPVAAPATQLPSGNRRGTFAATPQGKPGAPGTPDIAAGTGDGGSSSGSGNAPSGIYVGRGPQSANSSSVAGDGAGGSNSSSNDSRLVASATPPRVSSAHEVSPDKVTEEEKKVFGDRKFYSMSLNMPNLNSAGGSWVIHFAEMKNQVDKGDLSAPAARQKVDPAYPTELMKQNVAGTVTLYAVIHRDGSVDGVRVLNSPDDRLDEYARSALARWRFYPATKNGNPVDLEAVVTIPFRPIRVRNSF
jgi:TonB family protein